MNTLETIFESFTDEEVGAIIRNAVLNDWYLADFDDRAMTFACRTLYEELKQDEARYTSMCKKNKEQASWKRDR